LSGGAGRRSADAERETALDFDGPRHLRPSDAAAAAALIRAAFAEQGKTTDPPSSALRETAEIVAEKLAAGGGAGIERESALIGVVLWTPQADALYFGRLAVAPAWRGRGLARLLIAAAEAEARRRGFSVLRLNARLELPANRRLFARRGFADAGMRAHPGYAAPTIMVMEKALG
jgi:GNAT superfamily N-acetyltransferase